MKVPLMFPGSAVSGRACIRRSALLLAVLLAGCQLVDSPHRHDFIVVWQSPTRMPPESAWLGRPAADGGRVFVENQNNLVAFDGESGATVWSRRVRVYPTPAPVALLARNGRVYLSETDSVMAISEVDGHTIWNFHPDSQAVDVPALDDQNLYTGQRGLPVVYALSIADGTLRWKTNLSTGYQYPAFVTGIAVSGDTVYVNVDRFLNEYGGYQSGVLVALARSDGHELWRYETTGQQHSFVYEPWIVGRIAVLDDLLGMRLVGYDIVAGKEAWHVDMPPANPGRTIVENGVVYVAGADSHAYAIDPSNGRVIWKQPIGTSALNGGYCNGTFYINNEQLKKFNAATGAPGGTFSNNDVLTSGIASDGKRIYVTGENDIYAMLC